MTDAKKSLVEEMDADLEEFLKQKIEESKNKPRDFNFDNKTVDEIADELKQHPVFMTEFDETKPMSEAMEGLQALKYESNDNDENALNYKEDGNRNFGRKKYRWAIDSYTAGLTCKPSDPALLCLLLCNRAAAHFHIGNYRSSINDCIEALRHNPTHKKAWLRVIDSNVKLHKHDDVIQWCDKALCKFPDEQKILKERTKARQAIKGRQRDERKTQQKLKKHRAEKMLVVEAIKKRNIKFKAAKRSKTEDDEEEEEEDEDGGGDGSGQRGWLRMVCQEHNEATVELINGVELQWPVMFLYPETQQSDFVVAFHELSTFQEHVDEMFKSAPAWDAHHHYTPSNLNIYYEERFENGDSSFHPIPLHSSLLLVLSSPTFTLVSSLLVFYVFPKNCPAEKLFLDKNKS